MFDLTSSKLFLLAIVALLVIGPKDFPILLRTIGKYVGIIRGHAKEFRAQFDEAMRESELSQLKKEMESIGRETEASLNATKQSLEQTLTEARQSVETSVQGTADGSDAAGVTAASVPAPQAADALPPGEGTGTQVTADAEPAAAAPPAGPSQAEAAPAAARTGA
jgi:sec-independent protein translocase protein TatB